MSTEIRVEVYRRHDGKWAWRAVAPNGDIVATDGGQGYENHADAAEMAKNVTMREPVTHHELELGDDTGTADDVQVE